MGVGGEGAWQQAEPRESVSLPAHKAINVHTTTTRLVLWQLWKPLTRVPDGDAAARAVLKDPPAGGRHGRRMQVSALEKGAEQASTTVPHPSHPSP